MKDKIIIGRKPIMDALNEKADIEKIWISNTLKGEFEREVRHTSRQLKIPLQYVPKEKLTFLSSSPNHQGVAAQLSTVQYFHIEDILPHLYEAGKTPAILVLDGIEDVGNLGALARSAVWFGMDAIVVSIKRSARINSYAYKSSAGAIKDIPICRENSMIKAIEYMKSSGLKIVTAEMEGNPSHNNPTYKEPIALVMGSEGKGIVQEIKALSDEKITVPGTGKVESLNVSVAGALLMYDLFNSRTV